MPATPTLSCDDGSEIVLPFVWKICSACNGHGKSSAYLGAYTADEMAEAGPDFHDDYMRGDYDRTCETCDGDGKVKVVDIKKMPKAQVRAWQEQRRADREYRAEVRAEIRAGC